jgi:hypothetical protein
MSVVRTGGLADSYLGPECRVSVKEIMRLVNFDKRDRAFRVCHYIVSNSLIRYKLV